MTFGNPHLAWALLALLGAALIPLLANRQMLSRRARMAAAGLRGTALVLLALALMEPALISRRAGQAPAGDQAGPADAACLVDLSASVKPSEVERALAAVKQLLAEKKRIELILFGGGFHRVSPQDLDSLAAMQPLDWLKTLSWQASPGDVASTHLERALRAAAETSARSMILFSDGNETIGNAEKAVSVLASRGQRLTVIPLDSEAPDTLSVAGFTLPPVVLDGKELEGQVSVRSASAGQVRLEIRRGDKVIRQESVPVNAGLTQFSFKDKLSSSGFFGYTASIAPEAGVANRRTQDDRASGVVRVLKVPKVLVVSNDSNRLGKILDAATLEHRDVPPVQAPLEPSALSEFSAVVLDNIDASELPERTQKLIAAYVRDQGGGLLALGGDHGFGAGGWSNTEIEKVLPVLSNPKGYDRSLGLVILLDSSGSMAGFPIEYARRAVKEIIALMRGRWLGVVNFSHVVETAVSFQVIGSDSYVVRQDIEQIEAGGGTLFYQPLSTALDVLSKVNLEQKHVLMLSDGEAADFFMVRSLYEKFDKAGIKVSTMAVGRYVNQAALQEIADSTGGRFYAGEDFSKLPEMFKQAVKRISGPPIVEAPIRPVRSKSNSPLLAALPPGELPQLYGYDATSAKQRAEVLISSPAGDPLLAVWHAGVGKSAAFTSDFSAGWGRDWVSWSEAPKFLGTLLGDLGRLETSDYKVSASATGSQGRVVVDAIDTSGQYLNFLKLIGRLADPRGKTSVVAFQQTAPGRYETSFPLENEGVYRVSVCRQENGREQVVGEAAAALSQLPEYRVTGTNRGFLARLAAQTGGKLTEAVDASIWAGAADSAGELPAGSSLFALWPLFTFLGLGCFLAEIICRRTGRFSGIDSAGRESSAGEGAQAFQKIAENYLRQARDMDSRGEHAKASDSYLKARSYYLKAQQTEQAQAMWDRYRLLEDKRVKK